MDNLQITGYETECNCQHCGRNLKHGIRLSNGDLVGATCFAKKITAPRKYGNKIYRLTAKEVIRLAQVVQFHCASSWGPRFGVYNNNLTFEVA